MHLIKNKKKDVKQFLEEMKANKTNRSSNNCSENRKKQPKNTDYKGVQNMDNTLNLRRQSQQMERSRLSSFSNIKQNRQQKRHANTYNNMHLSQSANKNTNFQDYQYSEVGSVNFQNTQEIPNFYLSRAHSISQNPQQVYRQRQNYQINDNSWSRANHYSNNSFSPYYGRANMQSQRQVLQNFPPKLYHNQSNYNHPYDSSVFNNYAPQRTSIPGYIQGYQMQHSKTNSYVNQQNIQHQTNKNKILHNYPNDLTQKNQKIFANETKYGSLDQYQSQKTSVSAYKFQNFSNEKKDAINCPLPQDVPSFHKINMMTQNNSQLMQQIKQVSIGDSSQILTPFTKDLTFIDQLAMQKDKPVQREKTKSNVDSQLEKRPQQKIDTRQISKQEKLPDHKYRPLMQSLPQTAPKRTFFEKCQKRLFQNNPQTQLVSQMLDLCKTSKLLLLLNNKVEKDIIISKQRSKDFLARLAKVIA